MSGKKPNPRKKAAKGPPKPLPSIFISKEAVATFWFVVAAGAFIVGGVYAERLVANSGRSPQFVGIGTPGSVARPIPETRTTLAPAAALELRESQTRLLMESIFNKSGRGLDAPERCEKLMSKEAWDYVNQHLIEPQKEAFAEGKIHQKVSIQELKVTYRADSPVADVEVVGQLIRTGILDREIFNQVWSLRANVVWSYNPCLRDCGRYPLLCTSFGALEKPVSSTQRKLTNDEEISIRARAAAAEEAAKGGAAASGS